MTATDSLPISDLLFRSSSGHTFETPKEWEPFDLLLPTSEADFATTEVTVNGQPISTAIVKVDGAVRVVSTWERAGPGWYQIEIKVAAATVLRRRVRVGPSKIDATSFEQMLFDLEDRLPVTVAVALRNSGARIGVDLAPGEKETLATEVARLRHAVRGFQRPGLAEVLTRVAVDPHRLLAGVDEWVRSRDARRPHAAGLARAIWAPGNIEEGKPKRVLDRRVVHSVDLYENRLLKAFADEVERRLRRLSGILSETIHSSVKAEVDELLRVTLLARMRAEFLSKVGPLRTSPSRASMVLMKRPEYRAGYEGFLEFRRRRSVYLAEPAMTEPLANLPYLYQLWCTLVVIEEVLERASSIGWVVISQRLVSAHASGMYLDVLRDGKPAVEMRDDKGRRLKLIPERSFGVSSKPLASMSFMQRPDVAIELSEPGQTSVLLLDPKYKLDSDELGEPGEGTPKKVDIDKMHAYRDAIRDSVGRQVVRHAAILYPGQSVRYGDGVSAIRAYPGNEVELARRVQDLVEDLVE